MKKAHLFLLSALLSVPFWAGAAPRNPLPGTPDQVWQNDLDLNDQIESVNSGGSNSYIKNQSSLQTGAVFNISSGTVSFLNVLSREAIGQTVPVAALHISTWYDRGGLNGPIAILVNGTWPSSISHPVAVETDHPLGAGLAAAAYDCRMADTGSNDTSHIVCYQSRASNQNTGRLSDFYGFVAQHTVSAGTTTRHYNYYGEQPNGSGVIENNYGVYIGTMTVGTVSDWGIYVDGQDTPNYMWGGLHLGGFQGTGGRLNVSDGLITASYGADNGLTTRTTNTQKNARTGTAHYSNSEDLVSVWSAVNTAAGNTLRIGGGESTFNAATSVSIYTSSTNATKSGSLAVFITTNGYIAPLQPRFAVTNSTGPQNITGDGSTFTMTWPTEIYDNGSNFASNTFTAPADGYYHLNARVDFQNILNTHGTRQICIVTSNRTRCEIFEMAVAQTNLSMSVSDEFDMEYGDTATVTIAVAASTKVVDIIADANYNSFSGYLAN